MSHTIIGFDQAEEEILNFEVSDEALETAAGTGKEKAVPHSSFCNNLHTLWGIADGAHNLFYEDAP